MLFLALWNFDTKAATEALDNSPLIFWKNHQIARPLQQLPRFAKIWQVHQFTLKVLWHSDIWLVFHQQQEVVCRKLEVPAQSSLNQKYSSCENQNFMAKSYCNWPHLVTNKGLCSTHFTHLRCYILPPALLFCSALCLRRLANSNLDTLLSSIPAWKCQPSWLELQSKETRCVNSGLDLTDIFNLFQFQVQLNSFYIHIMHIISHPICWIDVFQMKPGVTKLQCRQLETGDL